VATVELEGDLAPFTREQILKRMREKPGTTFKVSDARRDATRIRSYLAKETYRRADVDFLGHTYDTDTNTVALRYKVDVGPKVRVDVTGVPRKAVRRQLPFRGDQEYSEDTIDRAAEDIVLSYQRQGYYNATVDIDGKLDQDTNTWVTTFVVTPGQRYRLADVRFTGNTKISDKDLERLVETSPRRGFRSIIGSLFRRRTGVTRQQLSDDRLALEAHYRLQGFSQAAVDTPAVQVNPDGTMIVTFPITEGPQTILSQVNLEGVEQVKAGDLPKLQLEAGMPLNPQLLNEDIIALQTFYSERGNAEVQVTHRVQESADKTSATLDYVIAEGPQIRVGDIVVRGNSYTDDDVVLRKVDLDKGDPFTYTSILEAQRELYRLGIFQRADVQAEQAGTSVADRNVTIQVEEGRNLTVSGSLGLRADTAAQDGDRDFSYRVAAGVAHRNLFGTGRYLGLQAVGTAGGVKEQELFITYREPFIGRYNVPVQLTVFQTDDATRKETRLLQRGMSIEASRVSGYRTRWSLQYQYKISECIEGLLCDEQNIISPGGDRSFLNIQISSITPTFFWDKRDDVIDPHRGFFTSASVEYAFPLFSAKANFTKQFVQGAWYIPITERSVVALSSRIGLIQPIGGTLVPLSERFTAGGDTSHRAYPLDLLGTLCSEDNQPVDGCGATLFDLNEKPGQFRLVPLGGNSMFIANAEYRFPIFSSLGGAVFADIGNVFASSTIDFGDLRYGAGAGLRYLSPVGPLRFDVGVPLNKRDYDRSFSWFITLGYAF
jgi:outer membrane protein insertion porin family